MDVERSNTIVCKYVTVSVRYHGTLSFQARMEEIHQMTAGDSVVCISPTTPAGTGEHNPIYVLITNQLFLCSSWLGITSP